PNSADKKPDQPNGTPKVDDSADNNLPGENSSSNLPSRRAGRFMDMKHNSSDMKKDKDNAPSLMTSSKATLSPLNPDTKPDSPKEDADSGGTNADASDKNDSKEALPDSTNRFTSQQEKKMQLDSPMDKKDNDARPSLDEDDFKKDDKSDTDKKASPFIDDAKVAKRPLGGFSSESPVEPVKGDDKGDAGDSENGEETQPAQTPSEPIELPPELDKDLVAIESGVAPEVPAIESNPTADDQSQDDDKDNEEKKEESADEKDEPAKKDHKEEVSQLLASAAGGSIPDQYKRENRSHELHAAHPLFDSEHFKNSPQSAPKKPKSKLKSFFQWVFISVGLLLLGGSLGAAVFVFSQQ
ncbi:MAG: hypothetical protein AAB395_02495, partial [Patescibacteria group bacterium]